MRMTHWLATAALSATTMVGTSAHAGFFDRLRGDTDRSEARESSAKEATADGEPRRFAVADAGDIGKIVSPVAYQSLPGPGLSGPGQEPLPPEPIPMSGPGYGGPAYGGPGYGGPTPAGPHPADLSPVEGFPAPGVPMGGPYGGPLPPIGPGMPGEGFPLYPKVEYDDIDEIHPLAQPMVVQVLDPCSDKARGGPLRRLIRRHHDDCDPQFVYVEICAPPGCPKVRVSRGGTKVTYHYGDYKIEIKSKNGIVYVEYDD